MSQSISIINEYLIESNQSNDEQIPLLCGKCPTYKHFQAVFQRTIGFFSSQLSTNNLDTPYKKHSILKNTGINFGEEAHNIIKSMKYPFSHEINKSHLTTTNPHSWPVILSFLRWLVEMIYICKNYIKNEKSDDILTEGYRKFMEGDDYFFENSLRQKSNSENNHLISEMEGLSQVNEVLSSLISQSRDVSHGIS
ncbi:centromere associated protein, partial [Pseudoloma neurophilia]